MMRSCSVALLVLCGLATTADAQVYTSYYRAPAYGTSYANYAPGTMPGPLRVFDWRWWAGTVPYDYPASGYGAAAYAPTAYTAAYAPTTYTAGYTPAGWNADYYAATSYYSPSVWSASYFTPSYDTAIAYYPSPYVAAPGACCSPCVGGVNPNCPGGNCGMNYQPTPVDGPQPDGTSNPSSSGVQQYERESDPAPGAGTPTDNAAPGSADWRDAAPGGAVPMDDGFNATEGGANYGPSETIEPRAPINPINGEDSQPSLEAEPAPAETPEEEAAPAGDAEEPEASIFFRPITPDPESALPLVNRDSRISGAPSVLPERRQMSARFGSPELARAKVSPKNVPSAKDLKLVRK